MKRTVSTLALIATPFILSACTSLGSQIAHEDLQHHHWNLLSINDQAVDSDIKSDLEIGEQFKINGKAGCNRFFGEAKLEKNKLAAPHLATTMMACSDEAQEIESAVLNTLGQGAKVTIKDQQLTLKGEQYTLVYQLADWM